MHKVLANSAPTRGCMSLLMRRLEIRRLEYVSDRDSAVVERVLMVADTQLYLLLFLLSVLLNTDSRCICQVIGNVDM